jgi:MarR family transcriptional regulator, negative regulator of the multidrug operon emrRAB
LKQEPAANEEQARLLHLCISKLMRELRLEPGLLAGNAYAGLHANDVELFELLTQPGANNVRAIAVALGAPISTISSALDRLEGEQLIRRIRISTDRRMVCVELTPRGKRLATRLSNAHVHNCVVMLSRLALPERDDFVRLARQIAGLK